MNMTDVTRARNANALVTPPEPDLRLKLRTAFHASLKKWGASGKVLGNLSLMFPSLP